MAGTQKRIAVVILNWNGRFFLESFLPDVLRFSQDLAEIIVADNASSDDSISWLKKHLPEVRIIQLDKNLGFTGGYNEALKQVSNEYYVLLNSDVRVTEGWLEPLLELMDNHPERAACQPKICSLAHPTEFEYAGAGGGLLIITVTRFAEGESSILWRKTKGNSTIRDRYSGLPVHVCLFVHPSSTN